ncbi:hypothetical protein K2Z83_24730 [Oscillochloris sp. ZM17-4]|uniref:hypothetical protein n=1 Tax=Oscillochloris sp. ZM17-4 TaxID=2866714 RepID=UPI001C72B6E4|nr:hypothetical protein [Oscillochloris sp. ZM17-4]MBX0330866.1 hypothetical protein [Oscillochloris sp. ZM17-4]
MQHEPPAEYLAGLDEQASDLVRRRWSAVAALLTRELITPEQLTDYLQSQQQRARLSRMVLRWERTQSGTDKRDLTAFRNASLSWRRDILLPLVRDADLYEHARLGLLQRYWGHGHFDRAQPVREHRSKLQFQPPVLARPSFDQIVAQALSILTDDSVADIAAALLQSGLCISKAAAEAVASAFNTQDWRSKLNEAAAGLARSLLLTTAELGPVGALAGSEHPLAQTYLALQRMEPLIAQMTDQPAPTIAQCRADLSALYTVLSSVKREKLPRHQTERAIFQAGFISHITPSRLQRDPPRDQKQHTLWREDFLHLPPGHRERQQMHGTLASISGVRSRLTTLCGDDSAQAAQLLNLYVTRGIEEIIDWRCGATPGTLSLLRVTGTLDRHLGGLTSVARERITTNIAILRDAIVAVGLPIDLYPLLSAQTGGAQRRQWGRRAPYGVARYAVRRGQRLRQRVRPHAPRRQRRFSTADDGRFYRLADEFADRAGLTTREGRDRIRATLTYGGIGMLPRTDWPEAVDRRLFRYLCLFKFGRVDGTLLWQEALALINEYAAQLGLADIGIQITRALLSTLPKPRRWPGGVGPAVYTPRHRLRTRNSGYLRLHRVWRLIPITFQLKGRTREKVTAQHGVLVLDIGSARPVGVWVADKDQVGDREAALALYQAIWHPGAIDWPLRGIPEIIQVDASLASGDLNDIKRAAHWLAAKVQVVAPYRQKRLSNDLDMFSAHTKAEVRTHLDYTVTLIENRLAPYGAAHIYDMIAPRDFTPRRVQDSLLAWLRHGDGTEAEPGCFPHHRCPDVPLKFRQFGFTLPGFDSPAAGSLLPVVAEGVAAEHDTIVFAGRRYGYDKLKLDSSLSYAVRAFPYHYQDMPDSIFVEDDLGRLYYLIGEVQ